MRYTDLIFDLYGTLVDIHTEENDIVWEKTSLFFGFHGAGFSPAQLRNAFHEAMKAREAAAGQSYECFPDIPFEQVMAELFRSQGVTENAESLGFSAAQLFRISSIEYIRTYPSVASVLRELRDRGFRLWLLSNAQAVFTTYELRLLELDALFDGVLLSSDYGYRKPDDRFYQALLDQHRLSADQCLMIGNDRETDIAGATHCGMATLYMHTALTPAHQAAADPTRHPLVAPVSCRHFEFEGDDWTELAPLLAKITQ